MKTAKRKPTKKKPPRKPRLRSFTVKRKTWCRGQGSASALLTPQGTRCCLGFLGGALGYPAAVLKRKAMPSETVTFYEAQTLRQRPRSHRWPRTLVDAAGDNTALCEKLSGVNDTHRVDDPMREDQITKLFKKAGLRVRFE